MTDDQMIRIIAAIAGMGVTVLIALSAWSYFLFRQMNVVERRLISRTQETDKRIVESEERLNKRIGESEGRLISRIQETDKRIVESEGRLSRQRREGEERLTGLIAGVGHRLDTVDSDIRGLIREVGALEATAGGATSRESESVEPVISD